jgi:hypothetical protein
MSASSSHTLTEAEFPVKASPRQKLGFALKYLALATEEWKWQPSPVRLEETYLELLAREVPDLETTDRRERESIVGCGATLTYLKLALKHFGCLGRVAVFPDLGRPELVARVHFGSCGERDAQEEALFETMAQNRTNIPRSGTVAFSEAMLTLLIQATAGERAWLEFVRTDQSRERVMDITSCGGRLGMAVDPSSSPAADPVARHPLEWLCLLPDFEGHDIDKPSGPAPPVRQALAVVKTKTDDKHGWLAAGQTMARIFLQAQALGLSLAFFNPIRRRAARQELRLSVGHKGFAQATFGLGPVMDAESIPVPVSSATLEMGQYVLPLSDS